MDGHRAAPPPAGRRRWAIVVLFLQALLWMAGPTIEARAEAASAGATAHVEDIGSKRCPPIHSHLDCQICRTLRAGAPSATAVAFPCATLRAPQGVARSDDAGGRAGFSGAIGSRAPPTA